MLINELENISALQLKQNTQYRTLGKAVLEVEAKAVFELIKRLDENFDKACEYLLHCQGRIVVIGMGKSGHICKKIAATLASTGSPAFFVHPAEASHGDLGMITGQDVVLTLSNSGNTQEILEILPLIKRLKVPMICLSGNPSSPLALNATVNLDVSVDKEACPLNLAPTASTTAALAMGDALAIALLSARGFTENDFAKSHPGGKLGKRLLLRAENLMHSGDKIPTVTTDQSFADALVMMTSKGLGMTAVMKTSGELYGIFTDGDVRRVLNQSANKTDVLMKEVVKEGCKTIRTNTLVIDALNIMENYKITSLLVLDEGEQLVGVLHLHDILRSGVV